MTLDLSQLPAPNVVESLSFEQIRAEQIANLRTYWPELDAEELESEPVIKLLEATSYRELLLRQRINDAARSVMLATAAGADLDQLAALFAVERAIVIPADPDARPPVEAVLESDARLRERTQQAIEGFTSAGSAGAYQFHALTADPRVRSVSVRSPAPGEVTLTLLSNEGDGILRGDLLQVVRGYFSNSRIRPLTDTVTVEGPEMVPYQIAAVLSIPDGPDSEAVRTAAEKAVRTYALAQHRLGGTVARSGILAGAHVPGVDRVQLTHPAADVVCTARQAPWPTTEANAAYTASPGPDGHPANGIEVTIG
ncbi:MAG: baseplate J/gp47 family protein [Acidobacteriota bacterium]|nr:baseplate J/gp47 family protein [Acidobacteriota bacterium]